MGMSIKFAMAQAIARKILEHSEFSTSLRERAREFTADKNKNYWRTQEESWETRSISWNAIKIRASEWEGKL